MRHSSLLELGEIGSQRRRSYMSIRPRVSEEGLFFAGSRKKHASGAKAQAYLVAFAARLKSRAKNGVPFA
jgi:hypothetical protein